MENSQQYRETKEEEMGPNRLEKWFSRDSFVEFDPPQDYFKNGWRASDMKKLDVRELAEIMHQGRGAIDHVTELCNRGNLLGANQVITEIVLALPREEIDLAVNLRLRRTLNIMRMGFTLIAYKELKLIDCFDEEYENFTKEWPGRRGKIAGFSFQFLRILLSLQLGRNYEAIDGICRLLVGLRIGKYNEEGVDPNFRIRLLTGEFARILSSIEEYELAEDITRIFYTSAEGCTAGVLQYNLMKLLIQNRKFQQAHEIFISNNHQPGFPLEEAAEYFTKVLP